MDQSLMVAGAEERPAQTTALHLYLPDADDAYARAIDDASSTEEPGDTPCGVSPG